MSIYLPLSSLLEIHIKLLYYSLVVFLFYLRNICLISHMLKTQENVASIISFLVYYSLASYLFCFTLLKWIHMNFENKVAFYIAVLVYFPVAATNVTEARKGLFGSQFQVLDHHYREVKTAGSEAAGHFHSQEQSEMNTGVPGISSLSALLHS